MFIWWIFFFSISLLITECIVYMDVLQHFPIAITKTYLRAKQKDIKMTDVQADQTYNCIIRTAKRNKSERRSHEKFIRQGWHEYAKTKKLRYGDVLSFRMRLISNFMYVHLRRNWCLVLEVHFRFYFEDGVVSVKVCFLPLNSSCLNVNFGLSILVICIKLW